MFSPRYKYLNRVWHYNKYVSLWLDCMGQPLYCRPWIVLPVRDYLKHPSWFLYSEGQLRVCVCVCVCVSACLSVRPSVSISVYIINGLSLDELICTVYFININRRILGGQYIKPPPPDISLSYLVYYWLSIRNGRFLCGFYVADCHNMAKNKWSIADWLTCTASTRLVLQRIVMQFKHCYYTAMFVHMIGSMGLVRH